ncbi:Crp/Fnr family transcriptional regulator [Rufibacter radiotolerans]|uniref:Crp/Fnr family transcriptional regulator n=1 Tax=Rufibacter radiotolerans TaxID=1379910 RepID=A0A0H4VQJ0_9BACT|nr:Crp/Fnr family transcriptional regulator [Rufibacter radiotolerans]
MKSLNPILLFLITTLLACSSPQQKTKERTYGVLVFYKTAGFYHNSIPAGLVALQELGKEHAFTVDTTNNAAVFTAESLKKYRAVIFLSTTQNVLDPAQEKAMEGYIKAGGGFVGIHAATDTEYDWPWYNQLVGAQFASHPAIQEATVRVLDHKHPATSFLPASWQRKDEWYNFKNISPNIKVLATLDEATYTGGQNGDHHPIAWYHAFDGGRAFYTGGGHTKESFQEPLFRQHLLGGILYAMGKK